MSFAVEARKVRNQELPYGARVRALCHCLEMYSPLGFQLTWDYLEHRVGNFREQETALLAAFRLIDESRNLQTAESAAYAKQRAEQKARGQRTPIPGATTPRAPRRWHASPADAALFALERRGRFIASDDLSDQHRTLIEGVLQGDRSAHLGDEVRDLIGKLSAEVESQPQGSQSRIAAFGLVKLADHLRVAIGAY